MQLHKSNPQDALTKALAFTEQFKNHAKEQTCPACNQKGGFKVGMIESGKKGWETRFVCNCGLTGVLNQTGFHFEGRTVTK